MVKVSDTGEHDGHARRADCARGTRISDVSATICTVTARPPAASKRAQIRRCRGADDAGVAVTRRDLRSAVVSSDPRHVLGRLGEQCALEHLERLGYTLVARNHRTRFGEIDLVVRGERALVFVEVKTRRALSGPARSGTRSTSASAGRSGRWRAPTSHEAPAGPRPPRSASTRSAS